MAVISAVVTASMRHASSLEEARTSISARIEALSRSQSLISRTEGDAEVDEVVREAISPFLADKSRLTIDGPPITISSQQVIGLSLAIYELATNAAKYGALSVANGQLAIGWSLGEEGQFEFSWRESNGPRVFPPTRTGFGTRLTSKVVPTYFAGSSEMHYDPEGVHFLLHGTVRDGAEEAVMSAVE